MRACKKLMYLSSIGKNTRKIFKIQISSHFKCAVCAAHKYITWFFTNSKFNSTKNARCWLVSALCLERNHDIGGERTYVTTVHTHRMCVHVCLRHKTFMFPSFAYNNIKFTSVQSFSSARSNSTSFAIRSPCYHPPLREQVGRVARYRSPSSSPPFILWLFPLVKEHACGRTTKSPANIPNSVRNGELRQEGRGSYYSSRCFHPAAVDPLSSTLFFSSRSPFLPRVLTAW